MYFGFWWILFEVIKAFSTEHLKYFCSLISLDLTLFILIFTQLSFLFFSRLKQTACVSADSEDHDYLFDYWGYIKGLEMGEGEHEEEAGGHFVLTKEVRKCRVNEKCFVLAIGCLAIFWYCSWGHCCCIHVIDVCTRLTSAWNSSFEVMEEALQ